MEPPEGYIHLNTPGIIPTLFRRKICIKLYRVTSLKKFVNRRIFFLQIELYSTFLKYHMVIRFVKAFLNKINYGAYIKPIYPSQTQILLKSQNESKDFYDRLNIKIPKIRVTITPTGSKL